ncbi:MAG: DUF3311 domain-containing protein [Verrucomicrobiae bacterium]|nr:DUF3311 domain-containing protein [Verrucomicrobiae bacterium]
MSQRSLSRLLFAIFLVALIMGPGPGIYLINPDPENAEARRFVLGVPIVYAWAVFWLGVQAACVAVAYRRLWRELPKLNSGKSDQ